MYKSTSKLRVRYAETDQMSVVYYGIYPQYFEVGRVEAFRQLKLSYREMEEVGIMLPVVSLQVKYHKPALYDDELSVVTMIKELPSTKITFEHEIFDSSGKLLTTGSVVLVFVDSKTRRPRKAPQNLLDTLEPLLQN